MRRALLLALALAAPAAALDVPKLESRVTDLAGLFEESVRNSLEIKLSNFEAISGHQVAVLTLNSLEGEALESYSLKVARTWGLGRKGVNDGVLFVIVPGDRKLRIEVGHGLEGRLPDALAGRIIQNIVIPRFRKGDMPGGVVAGTEAILEAIDGKDVATQPDGRGLLPALRHVFSVILHILLTVLFFPLILFWVLLDLGSGGGWSSSGSSSSSGSGGFSGGGGSFGGGGASGSW